MVLLPLLGGCALFELAAIRASFPPQDGALQVGGLDGPVRVLRDPLGVPHVRADSERDAWFGLGFVHGQDRYWQADLLRHLAWGRVAEWLGEDAVPLDTFVRAMDLRRKGEALLEGLPPDTRDLLEAYTDGMNAGLDSLAVPPIEYRLLNAWPEPWSPVDAYAVLFLQSWNLAEDPTWGLAAWQLRDEADAALLERLFTLDARVRPVDAHWEALRAVQAAPFTEAFEAFSDTLGGRPDASEASNNWIVGPERSASGLPVLANDPHLGQSVPSLWYVADVAGGDLHVAGATLPGLMGFPIGHNETMAWGLTNVMADVVDVAVLERDGDGYVLEGVRQDLDVEEVRIGVGTRSEVTRTVARTAVGPVITEDGGTHLLALRWHALELADETPDVLLGLARGRRVADVLDLAGRPMLVAQNVVVADSEGDWAWQSIGSVPVRRAHTGRVPYPASEPGQGWSGWHAALPGSRAPEVGYVLTANTHPGVTTSAEGLPVDADALSSSWVPPHRYDRIVELLEEPGHFDADDVARQQLDVVDVDARALVPVLLEGVEPSSADARTCHGLLSAWDHRMETWSAGAAVWARFTEHLIRIALQDELTAEGLAVYLAATSPSRTLLHGDLESFLQDRPREVDTALAAACAALRSDQGPDPRAWSWGALHPLALEHPIASGRDILRRWNLPVVPFRGSGSTVAAAGWSFGEGPRPVTGMASLRLVVDLADVGGASLVHPGGQSGHPRHPDTDSHFDAFVAGERAPLWFWDTDVEARAVHTLVLEP